MGTLTNASTASVYDEGVDVTGNRFPLHVHPNHTACSLLVKSYCSFVPDNFCWAWDMSNWENIREPINVSDSLSTQIISNIGWTKKTSSPGGHVYRLLWLLLCIMYESTNWSAGRMLMTCKKECKKWRYQQNIAKKSHMTEAWHFKVRYFIFHFFSVTANLWLSMK